MQIWFILIISIVIVKFSGGQLLWNDPTINDMHCTYPPAIGFPQHIITAVSLILN